MEEQLGNKKKNFFDSFAEFMAKVVVSIAVLLFVSFIGYREYLDRQKNEALEEQKLAQQEQDYNQFQSLIKRYHADTSWVSRLEAGSPIFSIDIEKAWKKKKIVFAGHITNIERKNDDKFNITLTHSLFASTLPAAPLKIRLSADLSTVRKILKQRKENPESFLFKEYIVIAKILKIESVQKSSSLDDSLSEYIEFTGIGKLYKLLEVNNLNSDSIYTL